MKRLLTTLSLMLTVLIGSTGVSFTGKEDVAGTPRSDATDPRMLNTNLLDLYKPKSCPNCYLVVL
jgi:hypothetical protein